MVKLAQIAYQSQNYTARSEWHSVHFAYMCTNSPTAFPWELFCCTWKCYFLCPQDHSQSMVTGQGAMVLRRFQELLSWGKGGGGDPPQFLFLYHAISHGPWRRASRTILTVDQWHSKGCQHLGHILHPLTQEWDGRGWFCIWAYTLHARPKRQRGRGRERRKQTGRQGCTQEAPVSAQGGREGG